jgi:hypothetical protein
MRKKLNVDSSPEQIIKCMVEYMPEFYTAHKQFKDCVEFLKHLELELALKSLINLTVETEHYFSEEFWLALAYAADKMNITSESDYCRQQIQRNEKEVKTKTPFGWTTLKIDDTHFQHYISEKLKEEWVFERREKDKALNLTDKNGVHLKSHGRSGYIYYVDNGRMAEVEFELGINGIILDYDNTNNWTLPTKEPMSSKEKQKLKEEIMKWAKQTKNSIEFC